MNRFKSRKFWIAVGIILSAVLAELFGIEVEPEVLATIAFMGASYVFAQGNIDKAVQQAQVEGALDVSKIQLQQYAANLEAQLLKVGNVAMAGEAPSEDTTEA